MATATGTSACDFYDPDAVIPQNSPDLVATKVNTRPSPSPEPDLAMSQDSPPPYSRSGKAKRTKSRPSQGDAVLIGIMGDGRDRDIAAHAGQHPLASDEEYATSPSDGGTDEADVMGASPQRLPADYSRKQDSPPSAPKSLNILAQSALAQSALNLAGLDINGGSVGDDSPTQIQPGDTIMEPPPAATSPGYSTRSQLGLRNDNKPQPLTVYSPFSPGSSLYTPRTGSFASPTASHNGGELPPIQASPRSQISLPSLKDHIGVEVLSPPYATSPPGHGMYRLPSISQSQGSPPISPHELNPRSPHPPVMSPSAYSLWAHPHCPSVDYTSGSNSTPSDQSVSTPATSVSLTERMTMEGMVYPNSGEQGQYICLVEGCNAPPFQTQYLLNSHANVHSQSRPHYCAVSGCPRAEGGKGFKRKNEMIRHGLVHESPGYVCPFCPDREHRYPRPDNLQRHVKVHHPEKDKDDHQLREVLSQRSDGPSRGRRRRGAS